MPNVQGNRRAALTDTDGQGTCPRVRLTERLGLPMLEKLGEGEANIFGDLTQERWCDIAT